MVTPRRAWTQLLPDVRLHDSHHQYISCLRQSSRITIVRRPCLFGACSSSPSPHPAPFSSSVQARQKKKSSNNGTTIVMRSSPNTTSSTTEINPNDPFDFTTLKTSISHAIQKLTEDLSKIRPGGRFNPEVLERLRVVLKKQSGDVKDGMSQKETVKLGEIAQVVPRGRMVHVMVAEKDHLKQITTAIQSSPYSLNPQPPSSSSSPNNDNSDALEIRVPIPITTQESRLDALKTVGKAGGIAHMGVREARQTQQKRLRRIKMETRVRADDLVKASRLMEKEVEKGVQAVKDGVIRAKRALEGGGAV